MQRLSVVFFTFLGLVALPAAAAAQTTVSPGILPGSQTWTAAGSPYVLSGDVTVQSGNTLTVEAGATVQFRNGDALGAGESTSDAELRIEGSLVVQGTEASPVTFTSAEASPARGDWYGVVVLAGGSAQVAHADLRYATYGLYVKGSTATTVTGGSAADCTRGVHIEGGTPSITGMVLRDNSSYGAYVTGGSTATLTGLRVYGNGSYGIYAYDASPTLSDSLVYDNGNRGIQVYANDTTQNVLIRRCTVVGNSDGVYAYEGTGTLVVQLTDSIVTGNSGYGLYSYSGADLRAGYTLLWGNGTDNYYAALGSGMTDGNPLFVDAAARDLRITSNSPARLHGSSGGDQGALAFDGVATPTLTGHLYANTTLDAASSPHTVTGDLTVEPGVTLTIEPGTTVQFDTTDLMAAGESTSKVELRVLGTLLASGTDSAGIVLRSAGGTPAPGDWEGVHLYGTSTNSLLDYVTVQDAVYGVWSDAGTGNTVQRSTVTGSSSYGVYVTAGALTVSASRIHDNGSYGVRVGAASPTVTDSLIYDNTRGIHVYADGTSTTTVSGCTIVDNDAYGIYAYEGTGTVVVNVTDSIVTGHTSYGLYAYSGAVINASYTLLWGNATDNYYAALGSGMMSENPLFVDEANRDLRITSNSPARLHASDGGDMGALAYDGTATPVLAGHLYASTTLGGFGAIHTIAGDLTIEPGVTLTVQPGAVLRFATTDLMGGGESTSKIEVRVLGTLLADGTSSAGITMGSDAATPADGDWYGVHLYGSASGSLLDYVTVRDAVYGVWSDAGADNTVQRSTLTGNSSYGVYVTAGDVTVRECRIHANGSYGVRVAEASPTIADSLIYDNSSRGIYVYADGTHTTTVSGCTIVGNGSQGIYAYEGTGTIVVNVTNSIVTDHGSYGLYAYSGAEIRASYSLLWGNGTDNYGGALGSGMMSENPLFVDAVNRDLRITSNSPARLHGSGGGDMGALAYDGAPTIGLQGHLYTDAVWGAGTHPVLGDITVEPGVALTVEAGADVQVATTDSMGGNETSSKVELRVLGRLLVTGTGTTPARFHSAGATPAAGDWYGIHLLSGSTSSVAHAVVEHGIRGVRSEADSSTVVSGGELRNNSSYGIEVSAGSAVFDGIVIHDNGSHGVSVTAASPDLYNLVIHGNGSRGIHVSGDGTVNVDIEHATIAGNASYGLYAYEGTGTMTVNLKNSIVASNAGSYGVYAYSGAQINASYNDVWGHGTDYYYVTPGAGSVSANPLFVDPGTGNYHLTQSSPVIDVGTTSSLTTDVEGTPRPLDGNTSGTAVSDLGAYEYNPAANKWPVANAGPDQVVESGLVATFDGTGSYDPDGSIVSWAWDFGDGATGTGAVVTHTFTGGTDRVVTLTVTDDQGATATDTANVEVNLPPVAEAGSDQYEDVGIDLSFNGAGSSDPDGSIASYQWSFGDGTFASGQSVTHQYAQSGSYTVTLTVTDDDGSTASDTATAYILGGADTTAPTIAHTPVANGRPEGQAVTVSANVTDATGVGSVTLHYRRDGAATFSSVAMVRGAGDTYTAGIPAATVRLPAVEYWIEATDTASTPNTGSSPAGAPAVSYRFSVSDGTAPAISHSPVADGRKHGLAVPVGATVTDSSGVASVTLHYRTVGASTFSTVAMATSGGDAWSGSIPAAAVQVPGIEYYIVAVDSASGANTAYEPAGAPGSVHAFTVTDQTAPVIAHTPVADDQPANQAVTVSAGITDDVDVTSATVHYRRTGAGTWSTAAMTRGAGESWSGSIPGTAVTTPSVEYWIEAADAAGNIAGDATSTWTFTVVGEDTTAPDITHSPVADDQVADTAITVSAVVTDGTGVGSVFLYYRTQGSGSFSFVAMTAGGGTTYTADIPAAAVQPPGVEYYLEAVDTATTPNSATEPAGAPSTMHSFTVVSSDTTGPSITHTPVSNGQPEGQAVSILAGITDIGGVASATLYYRATGAASFGQIAMVNVAGDDWSADVPAGSVTRTGVDYYVEAVDAAGNVSTEPPNAPSAFHTFTVEREFTMVAGDLVVTEIMNNPSGTESVAEWFEVYNATGAAIDLDGLTFADDDSDAFTVSGSVTVPAFGYVVLGRSSDTTANGGVPVDYVYSGMSLSNASDEIVILAGDVVIDRVAYDDGATFPDTEGYSMTLDPGALDHVENDAGSNWCLADSTLPGGDYGTPRAGNDSCAPPEDLTAPVLTHTPVTDGQAAGQPVPVSVVAVDDSGVASVTLLYRAMGDAGFTEEAMVPAGGDAWQADIPGHVVTTAGVEYYIEAVDAAPAGNLASAPETGVFAFTVTETDTSGPSITHEPVDGPLDEGVALTVSASITDGSGIDTAILHHRTGGGAWSTVAMVESGAGVFEAEIPAQAVLAPSLEYWLEATDLVGNGSALPEAAEQSPFLLEVVAPDLEAPVIVHDTVADGRPAGFAVGVSATVTDASGVEEVRVYFRAAGSATFLSAPMTTADGDLYTGEIPAGLVGLPAVEYYLEAVDASEAQNTARDPAGAPDETHTFTVSEEVEEDVDGPVIVHTPIADGVAAGEAVLVEAEITDPSGVASVTLAWRTAGSGEFTETAMELDGTWSAMIPAEAVTVDGVEYYLRAVDGSVGANVSVEPAGAPGTVHFFAPAVVGSETGCGCAASGGGSGGALLLLGLGMLVLRRRRR